jgi:hypothetical protein
MFLEELVVPQQWFRGTNRTEMARVVLSRTLRPPSPLSSIGTALLFGLYNLGFFLLVVGELMPPTKDVSAS